MIGNSRQLIVLAHGFFDNKKTMNYLESGLKSSGYSTFSVNLPTYLGTIDECCFSLRAQIDQLIKQYETVHFVAHSMGGLIIQKYLTGYIPCNLGNCVFIATPNRGSKLADIISFVPLVNKIFKSLNELKTDSEHSFNLRDLKTSTKIGIIAGTKNNLITGKLFLSDKSDGRVEIESAKNDFMHDYIEFYYGHREIHKQPEVLNAVKYFINEAKFK
ncbi:MAG TPA: alpha/beta fold hydrolase [Victivallales bacterium]|nr:alpha/beta fold hydrolase [Victivallales bacterium]